ncbi:hypothetical protein HG530_007567 [Fusarium avenaceum]|nr:hypothetical protein HG530_007567 [Fusarium avenaceum]
MIATTDLVTVNSPEKSTQKQTLKPFDGNVVLCDFLGDGAVTASAGNIHVFILNLLGTGELLACVKSGEVDLVGSLVFEGGVEGVLHALDTSIDKVAQVAERSDDTSRVEVLGVAIRDIAVTRLGSIDIARQVRSGNLGALCLIERRPAHLISAPEQSLLQSTLMSFLDRDAKTVSKTLVRFGGNLEVALNHNLNRQLSQNIVAITEENQVVVGTTLRKLI